MKEDLKQLKRRIEALTGLDDIAGPGRNREYVIARAIFYSLALKLKTYSADEIARFLGRDRTTLLYAIEKLEEYLELSPKMKEAYSQIDQNQFLGESRNIQLEKEILRLKKELKQRSEKTVPKTHASLVELINKVPEHQVEYMHMRLEPIIKMLPKTYSRNG